MKILRRIQPFILVLLLIEFLDELVFGIIVLIILDLAGWTVGAEVLHPKGIKVTDLDSLAMILGESFGLMGIRIFSIGVFAALFSSIAGNGEEGVELYDYLEDPNEYRNLAGQPGYSPLLERLGQALHARIADAQP